MKTKNRVGILLVLLLVVSAAALVTNSQYLLGRFDNMFENMFEPVPPMHPSAEASGYTSLYSLTIEKVQSGTPSTVSTLHPTSDVYLGAIKIKSTNPSDVWVQRIELGTHRDKVNLKQTWKTAAGDLRVCTGACTGSLTSTIRGMVPIVSFNSKPSDSIRKFSVLLTYHYVAGATGGDVTISADPDPNAHLGVKVPTGGETTLHFYADINSFWAYHACNSGTPATSCSTLFDQTQQKISFFVAADALSYVKGPDDPSGGGVYGVRSSRIQLHTVKDSGDMRLTKPQAVNAWHVQVLNERCSGENYDHCS